MCWLYIVVGGVAFGVGFLMLLRGVIDCVLLVLWGAISCVGVMGGVALKVVLIDKGVIYFVYLTFLIYLIFSLE